ncbi:MAG: ABC transporter permease [Rhodospirillaceae bacterium]|jgi:ABC-2 type transport system permease protein|nr:ABC transporter permease [Rhodospirillaceae bacterium]MBT4939069.1 ABC transporter permease [Rhodospirillaceae bacterium]MBT5941907.1 ABC transporter permease [Rhodospirillaceae bacterium]MBT7266949.1 ABC transporter permease [Rhodospirillaceae bacterium]
MASPQTPLKIRPVLTSTNWQGLWTLYAKEVHRYLKIFGQTLLAPIITTLLFLTVFGVAFGGGRTVNGLPYVEFLAPGLLMMTILQNAFANTSTSLIQQKLNENIVDTLMPPLSPMELTIGFVMSGATRGLMVAIGVGVSLSFVVPIEIHNIGAVVFYAVGAALMMGSMGMMTGIWAEKFDHVSTITNFIILPLSFLSGTFFPITRFPETMQMISHYNPFFYLIDGLRFGFTGQTDGAIEIGAIVVVAVNIVLWATCYVMFKTGYKIKD